MPKQKTMRKIFDIFKFTKSTYLICFLIAFLLFVTLIKSPLLNSSKAKSFTNQDSKMSEAAIYACDFEVFGKVQGVFFRKFTQKRAKELLIKGWCQNTADGTVRGQLEGPKQQLEEMKYWLKEVGSPKSRIDKTIFSETKQIDKYSFKEFSIRR